MDLENRRLTGEAVTIADAVGTTATGYASFSASHVGSLLYAPHAWTRRRAALVHTWRGGFRVGSAMRPVSSTSNWRLMSGCVAVSRVDEQQNTADIWTVDLERKDLDQAHERQSRTTRVPCGRRTEAGSRSEATDAAVADLYQKRSSGVSGRRTLARHRQQPSRQATGRRMARYILFTNTSSAAGSNIWFWPTVRPGEADA